MLASKKKKSFPICFKRFLPKSFKLKLFPCRSFPAFGIARKLFQTFIKYLKIIQKNKKLLCHMSCWTCRPNGRNTFSPHLWIGWYFIIYLNIPPCKHVEPHQNNELVQIHFCVIGVGHKYSLQSSLRNFLSFSLGSRTLKRTWRRPPPITNSGFHLAV